MVIGIIPVIGGTRFHYLFTLYGGGIRLFKILLYFGAVCQFDRVNCAFFFTASGTVAAQDRVLGSGNQGSMRFHTHL